MSVGDAGFLTTRWSMVARAASPESPGARDALEELCRAYWWPLYAYLRGSGIGADDSADLVQGLFADLIEKGRLAHADQDRGRFRGWLLSALKFHLSHEKERDAAAKRGGRAIVIHLDQVEADRRWSGIPSREQQDPERLFDRAWAIAVLDRALIGLEGRCTREGKAKMFAALKPFLMHDPTTEGLGTIAKQLRISGSAVKTAAFRLRKAFGDSIRAEVASTLDEDSDVEEEVRALFSALSSG